MKAEAPPVPVRVRLATEDDFAQCATLAGHFHKQTMWRDLCVFSHAAAVDWMRLMHSFGLLIVAEADGRIVGAVGGYSAPLVWNPAYKVGAEIMWYVSPEYRGTGVGRDMFERIEQRAKEVGCNFWTMVALEELEPNKVGAMYEQAGYRKAEHSYTKEL